MRVGGNLSTAASPLPAPRFVRPARNAFLALWMALLIGVIAILAIGGQPDPSGPGQMLDGPWRFHAGDDPRWAAPGTDDREWDRIRLVSRPDSRDGDVGFPGYFDGWRAHGHPGLASYGWYRRTVVLPGGSDLVLVAPPVVDDGYELFWDGRRMGGIGRLSGTPSVNATRPLMIELPPSNEGHVAVLAIRAFMQPGADRDAQSGGLRTAPVLASRADGTALYRAQWHRTIAGYVVDAVEPAAMFMLAAIALVAAPTLARPGFARWIALALVASALLRLGNAIGAWTDLISAPALAFVRGVIVGPLAKLCWVIGWNLWTDGKGRRLVAFAAVAAWPILTIGALVPNTILAGTGRAIVALCLLATAVRIAIHGEQRLLALAALLLTATGQFAADLSALGVPGIWFPFDIGVSRSQYAYAFALPLLALAILVPRGPRDGALHPTDQVVR